MNLSIIISYEYYFLLYSKTIHKKLTLMEDSSFFISTDRRDKPSLVVFHNVLCRASSTPSTWWREIFQSPSFGIVYIGRSDSSSVLLNKTSYSCCSTGTFILNTKIHIGQKESSFHDNVHTFVRCIFLFFLYIFM